MPEAKINLLERRRMPPRFFELYRRLLAARGEYSINAGFY
jgi:hypothetical protein